MPFKIGNKEATKKGKHEKTKQWEALGEAIVTKHADRLNEILDNCDDETFIRHYSNVLEYFKPKLARTELSGELDIQTIQPLVIQPVKVKDAANQ